MNSMVKVARYHFAQPFTLAVMPWANMAFVFIVCLIVFATIPVGHHGVLTAHGVVYVPDTSGRWTAAVASLLVTIFAASVQAIGRGMPFALALGASRRVYYAGTALLGTGLAFVSAAALTALQAIEQATDGWGVHMGFFRVPYILDGPWYATWLTSFVALTLAFVYGMWHGIVFRRWGLFGTVVFIATQVLVALAGVLAVTWTHAWPSVGSFFTGLTALGLTGVLALFAVALLTGGHITVRRATV
ncbi:MAG: hypothetical protein ACRDN0_38040 [Trebonia sp.]